LGTLKKFKKIAILMGGISDELEISNQTALEVFKTLKKKYEVDLITVNHNCKLLVTQLLKSKPDVVFNCLHGYFGEDGQIQSILNFLKIHYTHSGVLASAIAMNKHISKTLFKNNGANCPKGKILDNKINKKYNFPIIIKPINGGSSNGILKINNSEEYLKFISKKKIKLKKYLLEEFISGREITVGILENRICGIMEIIFDSDLYDYKNKYIKIAKHVLEPEIPKKISKELKGLSLKIHNALGCNCLSRLDYRYNEKKQKLYLLEINTQPGLTKNSLLPEMAKEKDIDFLRLCEIILENAICEKSY